MTFLLTRNRYTRSSPCNSANLQRFSVSWLRLLLGRETLVRGRGYIDERGNVFKQLTNDDGAWFGRVASAFTRVPYGLILGLIQIDLKTLAEIVSGTLYIDFQFCMLS